MLTNGSSRNWIWRKEVPAHLGVGPVFNDDGFAVGEPIWYAAQPFEKEADGCLYTDLMTFTLDDSGSLSYTLANNNSTYFNRDEVNLALGVEVPDGDTCYDLEVDQGCLWDFLNLKAGWPIVRI